ncbi:MAG: hypothetical protein SNJ82_09745 [Gemmataceae bacterium]
MTRVTVRVGYTGDDVVSARILDQISKHIKPMPGAALPSALTPVSNTGSTPTPIPAPPPVPATAPPPLAAPTTQTSLWPQR